MKTLKLDGQKRIRLPDFKPGQVFAYELDGKGAVTLTPVVKVETKAKAHLEKRNGFTLAVSERPITQEQVRAFLDEFP